MRKELIRMPYIGSSLSVNHRLGRRKGGGYYVKPEVKLWQEEYMWLLKRLHLEDWQLPLEITCSAWFTSEYRACDLVNFQKVVLDPIEDLTGINDKNMRWRDGTRNLGVKDPYLIITIKEGSGDKPNLMTDALQCDSRRVDKQDKGNLCPEIKRRRGRPPKKREGEIGELK